MLVARWARRRSPAPAEERSARHRDSRRLRVQWPPPRGRCLGPRVAPSSRFRTPGARRQPSARDARRGARATPAEEAPPTDTGKRPVWPSSTTAARLLVMFVFLRSHCSVFCFFSLVMLLLFFFRALQETTCIGVKVSIFTPMHAISGCARHHSCYEARTFSSDQHSMRA